MKLRSNYEHQQVEDIINNEFPKYNKMLEQCFDFNRRGFRLVFSGAIVNSFPSILYESEWCRVRFIWEIPDTRDNAEITHVLYGRLHAPVEERVMIWNGEKCYCWHEIHRVLEFLDGLSPQEAINRRFKLPPLMFEFYEANKHKGWGQAETNARVHAAVWDCYEQQLFDIFDLRQSKLWEQYKKFLIEYYKLWPEFIADPSVYKIC